MELIVFAKIVALFIGIIGVILIASAAIDVVNMRQAEMIEAKLVDIVQEYTARGFLWRAKLHYQHNGEECMYITRARTRKRGTCKINIHVMKDGRVVEKNYMIEKLLLGIVFIAVTIIFIILL